MNSQFAAALREFIEEGGYEICQFAEDGPPVLYRFARPANARFLQMLEFFEDSSEWPAILTSLKATMGGRFTSAMLLSTLPTYFRLS